MRFLDWLKLYYGSVRTLTQYIDNKTHQKGQREREREDIRATEREREEGKATVQERREAENEKKEEGLEWQIVKVYFYAELQAEGKQANYAFKSK